MIDKIQKVKNAMGFLLSAAYPEMIASEHKRNNDVLAELCKLVDSLKQDCFVSSKKCWAEVPITIPPNEDGVYMCLPQKDAFTYHNGMWWHGAYRVDGITHWLEPYTPTVEDGKQGGEVDLKEFSRCINALALELPAPVWDDVYNRWLKLKSSIIKSKSQPSTPVQGEWVRVEDYNNEQGRLLVFSPVYKETDPMRYRVIDSQFLSTCKDVTHYQLPSPPVNKQDL